MIAVLCLFEIDTGLVSKAAGFSLPVHVLVSEKDAEQAVRFGAQTVHTCRIDCADDRAVALWLREKLIAWDCNVVLAPATARMRGIMPILAWYMQAGLTADCTALAMNEGVLLQTRPAFGNALVADIRSTSKLQMATVRPGIFQPVEKPGKPAVFREEFSAVDTCVELLGETTKEENLLHQAKIIIAGGMGVGSREGFQKLEVLAKKLGAALAASRSAVDAGFAPYRRQVGMTGATVRPRLYIAVGISGAVQHIAGMSGAEKVVAVNTDPKAPIFDYADYGIVGDWESVSDKLWEALL